MTNTKFSPTELRTLHNKDFFYIKASVTKKMDALLADVRDGIKSEIKKHKLVFPKEVDSSMGKIFKGESYLGLPYLILDYPKYFSNDSVFAFRTMFWWGNFLSHTLHLQGRELKKYRATIVAQRNKLKNKNIFICVNDNPWQYHYERDNYILIDNLSDKKIKSIFEKNYFVKLSRKMELKDYKKLSEFAKETFSILASVLQYPVV